MQIFRGRYSPDLYDLYGLYDMYDMYDQYDQYDLYDLYDLAHVAGWKLYNLRDFGHVSWSFFLSVLHRSREGQSTVCCASETRISPHTNAEIREHSCFVVPVSL